MFIRENPCGSVSKGFGLDLVDPVHPVKKTIPNVKFEKMKTLSYLFLFFSLLFMGACSDLADDNDATAPADSDVDYPDQESWKATITITKDGTRVAEIWAGYIANYLKRNETVLKDSLHVDFYSKEGVKTSVLTADEGVVENTSRNMVARGNVIVVSNKGEILLTEILNWDNARQKIISDVPVRFLTGQDTLYGDSFISDPELKDYEIRSAKGRSNRLVPIDR